VGILIETFSLKKGGMAETMNEERIFAVVKENILAILDELEASQITMNVSLTELGANSLDRAEIATGAMEDLGLSFPMREMAKVGDIGDLVRFLLLKVNSS